MILFESRLNEDIHIYKDDATGDIYIYDGTKLVNIGNMNNPGDPGEEGAPGKPLNIGDDNGSDEDKERARKAREAELEKDKAEHPEEYEGQEETEEERQTRLDRIKDMLSDEVTGQEAEEESKKQIDKEKEKELRRIKANTKHEYSTDDVERGDIKQFPVSMKKFIASQLKRIKMADAKVPNQSYEGQGIMRRGKRRKFSKNIPVINVYFDQSGSWDDRDIRVGEDALKILDGFVAQNKIKINLYYFANHIHDNPGAARSEGGTGAGAELIEHIQATRPMNVIVMTDADFDGWGQIDSAPYVKVPGAVWFLFRNGEESKKLMNHLHGKAQNIKYYF